MINFQDRSDDASDANKIDLSPLSTCMKLLNLTELEIEEASAKLKTLNERHKRLREDAIPSIMQEMNIKRIVMSDGSEISIKNDWHAHISEANQPAAFQWLLDNNFGSLIKTNLIIQFPSGSEGHEQAEALALACMDEEMGDSHEVKESIHPQTLKSFVRERFENDEAFPLQLFGAYPATVAQIKQPKAAQKRK